MSQTETRAERRARRLAELAAHREATGEPATQIGATGYSLTMATPQFVEGGEFEGGPVEGSAQQGTLTSLAFEINTRLDRADRAENLAADHRLAAALRLAEAKKLCAEHRLNFRRWAEVEVPNRSWGTVRKLALVGASDNPRLALEDMRAGTAERNRALRQRKLEAAKERQEGEAIETVEAPPETVEAVEAPPETVETVEVSPESVDAEAPPSVDEPVAAELGVFDPVQDIMATLSEMTVEARMEIARRAALGLPAPEVRHVVEVVAEQIGLRVSRANNKGHNYFVSIAQIMMDFERLSEHEQREFLVQGAEKVGALIELPK